MIAWLLAVASASPEVVVSFDNGGFNLPLYTPRWNGRFEQPSVAQQLAADVSRTLGRSPRVFTYLPPGHTVGRSSDPYEVVPRSPGCTEGPCPCPPGERCWEGLDVNLHPAASTSLFQAATAIRARAAGGSRIEIHFTDLFEEDPASAANPADADRCVTADSTRKALEALMSEDGLDHVAVGRLSAQIVPPMRSRGGATHFIEGEGDCWTAERIGTFGGQAPSLELAMGVVVLGYGTVGEQEAVRDLIATLQRQVSSPLALDLVVVREPSAHLSIVPMQLSARQPTAALPPLPPRSTPCAVLEGSAHLRSGDQVVDGVVETTCDGAGRLALDAEDLDRVFRAQAGLDPRVATVDLQGTLLLRGDEASVIEGVRGLPVRSPVRDRPLPLWNALVDSLSMEGGGVLRPRSARLDLEGLRVFDIDPRPWGFALLLGGALGAAGSWLLHVLLTRLAANRAFRRHMHAGTDAPLAAVLQSASQDARDGWSGRLAVALLFGAAVAVTGTLLVLQTAGAWHG